MIKRVQIYYETQLNNNYTNSSQDFDNLSSHFKNQIRTEIVPWLPKLMKRYLLQPSRTLPALQFECRHLQSKTPKFLGFLSQIGVFVFFWKFVVVLWLICVEGCCWVDFVSFCNNFEEI